MLKTGTAIKDIADHEGFSERHVAHTIPITTLAPRIRDAIVTGTQPLVPNLETLVRARPHATGPNLGRACCLRCVSVSDAQPHAHGISGEFGAVSVRGNETRVGGGGGGILSQ